MNHINNNNDNNFLCANILGDKAQWRDKTKRLSNLVIVEYVRVGRMKVVGN